MFSDKLTEEREIGEIEFGAYFLDRLVTVAQLLADTAYGRLVYQVERRTARLVFHAFGEIFGCNIQHIGKD